MHAPKGCWHTLPIIGPMSSTRMGLAVLATSPISMKKPTSTSTRSTRGLPTRTTFGKRRRTPIQDDPGQRLGRSPSFRPWPLHQVLRHPKAQPRTTTATVLPRRSHLQHASTPTPVSHGSSRRRPQHQRRPLPSYFRRGFHREKPRQPMLYGQHPRLHSD